MITQSLSLSLPILLTLILMVIGKSANATGATKSYRLAQNTSYQTSKNYSSQVELPRWEFRTAPVALLARWYTLDVSYRLSEKKWATGPSIVLYNYSEIGNMFAPAFKGQALGWNANYYFDSAQRNTWYFSLHSYYEKYKSYPHAYLGYYEKDGYRMNGALGYQWRWNPVNLMAGLGVEQRNHNVVEHKDPILGIEQEPVSSSESVGLPYAEIKIGIQI